MMMKHITLILLIAVVTACEKQQAATLPAQSGMTSASPIEANSAAPSLVPAGPVSSRDQPVNAAPLGVEVGYANLAGVKQKLGGVSRLDEQGISLYSGGPVLVSDGAGLGIDGLSKLVLIFDKNNILAGVSMTLPKNPKRVLEQLAGKYPLVDNRIDNFMNYGYAKLEKGDSWVEISAPHLSFQMEVRYMTKQLMNDFQRQSAETEARKRQEQVNKL